MKKNNKNFTNNKVLLGLRIFQAADLRKIIIYSFFIFFCNTACAMEWLWGKGDVNLSKATWLMARPIPLITDKGGIPGGGPAVTPVDNLFNLPPGTKVNVASLGGTIDPTGTTIVNDFDGDGILNANETTTNVWVADFPSIESVIATPITMRVAVEKADHTTQDEVGSEINSDDITSGKSEGSEKIHQNELNLKTVQFQDQYSSTSENSGSYGTSVSVGTSNKLSGYSETGEEVNIASSGVNYGMSTKTSWENKNSLATTTTKWADRPFKNNLDSSAQNLKSDSASQKARKFRSEKSSKTEQQMNTKSDGGYVRAALYIKNNSANMPVKLSHILCSLMFEAPNGELIPVRSFELLKADGSNFEVEVYGGTEFGPYVVENVGLNGYEVERAIAAGYNPKIYIVDYLMTHVADSNYKSSLLNFSGDNLKIIEENAKGRTALIKVLGPNIRDMYRVTAFDAEGANSNPCELISATQMSPGISLENALKRIACSGMEIEFDNYVIDFSEIAPTLNESKLFMKGIKSIGGIRSTIPCVSSTSIGSDGVTRTACVQKPVSQWSEDELNSAGVWMVYSKGKYYSPTAFYMDGVGNTATQRKFNASTNLPAFMVLGVDSLIWAGDTYDITYISVKDLIQKQKQFGTNPLETLSAYKINTSWDLESTGKHPYYPKSQSLFLGDAGFGEKIQLNLKLEKTSYLNPNFGIGQVSGNYQYFNNFLYNSQVLTKKFEYNQIPDFEVSLGFGGERTDWMHIVKDLGPSGDSFKMKNCGTSMDFDNQIYSVCLELPKDHPYVDPQVSLIKVYIRPALNNAYRRSVWPLQYSQVRKVQGPLFRAAYEGDTSIIVTKDFTFTEGSAGFEINDTLKIYGDSNFYTISNVVEEQCELGSPNSTVCYKIDLNSPIKQVNNRFTSAFVLAGIQTPNLRFVIESNFYTEWNSQYASIPTGEWENSKYLPLSVGNGSVNCASNLFNPACLGINTDFTTLNWTGAYNLGVGNWNSWADAGHFSNFLANGVPKLNTLSGKVLGLETDNAPFTISPNNGALNSGIASSTVSYGDTALTVWSTGAFSSDPYVLHGRYYNLATGLPIGNEFIIKTAYSTYSFFRISASQGKAIIVWHDGDMLTGYARIFSLTTPSSSPLYPETSFNFVPNSNCDSPCVYQNYSFYLLADGNRAAILRGTNLIAFGMWNHTLQLTTINLNNGQVLTNNEDLAFLGGRNNYSTSAAFKNGKLYATSITKENGFLNEYVWSTMYVLDSGFPANSTQMAVSYDSAVSSGVDVSGNNGIFFYKSDGNIKYQIFDLNLGPDSAVALTPLDLAVTGGYTYSSKDNLSVIAYSKSSNTLLVKTINLANGLVNQSNPIEIDSTSTSRALLPVYFVGNKIIFLWAISSGDVNAPTYIKGRGIDYSSFQVSGSSPSTVLRTYQIGNVVTNGLMGFSGGSTSNSSPVLSGYSFNLQNFDKPRFGLNNFFVSPLIERDFTLQAKITY
ncbi:LIC12048 family lipoprotein [Leptospira haakeii]|uniref:Uncharacterized protein n=1 Tax=Leptospira haakeii TaxID=2023198 RepID=A0ABX4PNX0_9LEPT|nr:LIC12048 family lipoprotein [Leptospira haakeii]PKA16515.1 hypothetical protein CH363_06985 [Leptospira haakeii]PKA20536.1 hypothetical protein CH377_06390 [Leptospira haakeii]